MIDRYEAIKAFNNIVEQKEIVPVEIEKNLKTIGDYIYWSNVNYLLFEDGIDEMDDILEMESFNAFLDSVNKQLSSSSDQECFVKFIEEYAQTHDISDYHTNAMYQILLKNKFTHLTAMHFAYFGEGIMMYYKCKNI